jgi:hypothetical protein
MTLRMSFRYAFGINDSGSAIKDYRTGGLHRFSCPVPIYNEPGWLFSDDLFISKEHFTCNGSGKELLNSTRSLGTAYQTSQAIYSPIQQYRKVNQSKK